MRYYKRLKVYKASNVEFSPENRSAYSYDWWQFVREVNGVLVFNDYNYSPTTGRHQSKVRWLLRDLGLEIGVTIYTHTGLQALNGVEGGEKLAFEALEEAVKAQDLERARLIAKTFKVKLTQDFIAKCYLEKEEAACDAYLSRAFAYAEKKDLEAKRLKAWLEGVELLSIRKGERKLLVSKYEGQVSFAEAGKPEGGVKRDADFCSPNAIAQICIERLGFELSSEEVVKISNFC